MEEVLLSIVGGDEAEAALGHDHLHATSQHLVSPFPSRDCESDAARPFEKAGRPRANATPSGRRWAEAYHIHAGIKSGIGERPWPPRSIGPNSARSTTI